MELLSRGWLVFKRRWQLLALPLIVALGGAIALIEVLPKDYTASVMLFLRAPDVKSSASAYQGNLFTMQRVNTYVEMVQSDDLAQLVVDELNLDSTAHDLATRISAVPLKDTVLLNVSATDTDAQQAANIANSYGTQFANYVARVEAVSLEADAPPLVTVIKPASADDATTSAFSPRLLLIAAVLLGLLIGLLLIWLAEHYDTKVRSRRQVEELTGSRVLGNIKRRKSLDAVGVDDVFSSSKEFADEARVLSIATEHALREFGKRDGSSVLALTSAGEGDGKSVVTQSLATALTERGHRVGVLHVGPDGLSSNAEPATETLQVNGHRGKEKLTTGAPSEQAIATAIGELARASDFVIVDPSGPGAGPSSQLSASLSHAVLIVMRPGHTDENALTDLANATELLETPLIGVVANCARETNTAQRFYG